MKILICFIYWRGTALIHIIDAGIGNYNSVANMLDFPELDNEVVRNPDKAANASHVILPGVGAFDYGMKSLIETGWYSYLKSLDSKTKLLGICLGMQLMCRESEEGTQKGLDLLDLKVMKFKSNDLPVPHMGWNSVEIEKPNKIFQFENIKNRFYFSHSYYIETAAFLDGELCTIYGSKFLSGFALENLYGVQFHPEKSHKFGMQIFRNFASL